MLSTATSSPPWVRSAFRFYALRPTHRSATPERMVFGYLDDYDAQSVWVPYLHLAQPPPLVSRELENIHSGPFQLLSYGVHVPHLQPQTYAFAGPGG
jgi:hypothetical protein